MAATSRTAGIQARPNPFGRRTSLQLSLPRAGSTELGIYSADGRLIRTLPATGERVVWDGSGPDGEQVGRGIYYCRSRCAGLSVSEKLVKLD
jgi:hypothetical protein